jgi:hypothetical protein
MKQHAQRTPDRNAARPPQQPGMRVLQRKCACGNGGGSGGDCGSCADEKKKKIQRRALDTSETEIPSSVDRVLQSPGRQLDHDTRASMESRFGHDFSRVRVHTDTHAASSAHEIHAAAYTSGTNIVFGDRRFDPHTPAGRQLLAHELAHVVQQHGPSPIPAGIGAHDDVHERTADRMADNVVSHGALFTPQPVVKDADSYETFLEALDAAIVATSTEELRRLGRSTDGCPLLEQWRPRIRAMTPPQLESLIRRWLGGERQIHSRREYIPLISARLARSIRFWGVTGGIDGPFESGQPLDVSTAARMADALGRDLSNVRIHTDAVSASAASRMNARAFTIGNDIAFAHGEYRPGTIIGDALLAHELAHASQQETAEGSPTTVEDAALEDDADQSALYVLLRSLPKSVRGVARGLRKNAMTRLKSPLTLQRCSKAECTVSHPENCGTYKQWLSTMPVTAAPEGDLTAEMPSDLRDLVTGAGTNHVPDCADVSMIIRHYYLKAHGKSFSFLVGPTRSTSEKYTLGKNATDDQLRSCLINSGTESFQEMRSEFALVDFYKSNGKPITNLRNLLGAGLEAGDVFVWKRRPEITGNFEGHAQTVQEVVDAQLDNSVTPPKVKKPGKIAIVQGNMLHGKAVGQIQQRVYSFADLTKTDDGNADIVEKKEEYFLGAGKWKV